MRSSCVHVNLKWKDRRSDRAQIKVKKKPFILKKEKHKDHTTGEISQNDVYD